MDEREIKKNERTGLLLSLVFHGMLALVFFFVSAWSEPDPPIPEYGIELNFGVDNVGSGDQVQPAQPQSNEQEAEAEENTSTPETSEQQETTEAAEQESPEVTQTTESPDVVEQESGNQQQDEAVEQQADPQQSQDEEVKSDPATYPSESEQPQNTEQESEAQQQTSQGDNQNRQGDEGDPEGSIDEEALYGSKGGNKGASLQMAGWKWDYVPNPKDPSNETGRIVFRIKVDERGEVMGVQTLERTVSSSVESIYKREVEQLTFSTTANNVDPPAVSTGKITFIIESR